MKVCVVEDEVKVPEVSPVLDKEDRILELTAQIVSAHLSNNNMSANDIPEFIERVKTSLSPKVPEPAPVIVVEEKPELVPAVPIKKSVFPDGIICLEDGKKLKMLKRHLNNAFGMTPEQYRAKWGLPYDYPMVAEEYAKKRSELAKDLGLGRKSGPKKDEGTAEMEFEEAGGNEPEFAKEPEVAVAPEKKPTRGRAKKTA
ncbi:MucR family transcriptional regulator [Gluconobacter cerinus]|nr:MucR family transcriptional regulator [Gluconobacter cerinus]